MSEEEKKELNNLICMLEMHHIDSSILFKMKNLIQSQQKEIFVKEHINESFKLMINERDKKIVEMSNCIDKLKSKNKELLRKLRNRVKEVKKLTKYSLYKKEFSRLNKQLEKKDTIIDLMAKHLEKYSTNFLELYGANMNDWKQYFEKKVEGN